MEAYDVIIIGGGAAGLTAAIYCGRAKLTTLVLEKSLIGGLATNTHDIANYPGFPDGVSGSVLMNQFYKQAKQFGVKFKFTEVKSVDFSKTIKHIQTGRIDYYAHAVIIAGGGKPRLTGAKGEPNFVYDKGISFCATCDAAANKDKTIMVVGSGDSAIEESLFLTKFAKKVMVCVRHSEGTIKCHQTAKAQALTHPRLTFIWDSIIDEFIGDERLKQIRVKNRKTQDESVIDVDSCFLFIGYLPNTKLYHNLLSMNSEGYLITSDKMETNIEGVFAAGDIRDKFVKQIATAVGDGAIAGMSVENYIAQLNCTVKSSLTHFERENVPR